MTAPAGQTDATDTDAQAADNVLGDAADQQSQQNNDQQDGTGKGTQGSDTDWESEVKKWKALARKHEQAAKDLKPLADKAKQLEDAQKSDADKLREQLESATAELMAFRVTEVRRAAATQAGLPAEFAQFITATEPDDAVNQAKELIKLAGAIAGANGQAGAPAGNFKQGARQTPAPPKDKNQLFHALVAQNR